MVWPEHGHVEPADRNPAPQVSTGSRLTGERPGGALQGRSGPQAHIGQGRMARVLTQPRTAFFSCPTAKMVRPDFPHPPHAPSRSDIVLRQHSPNCFAQPSARARTGTRPTCCASGVCNLCPIDSKFTIQNSFEKFARDGLGIVLNATGYRIERSAGLATALVVPDDSGREVSVAADLLALGRCDPQYRDPAAFGLPIPRTGALPVRAGQPGRGGGYVLQQLFRRNVDHRAWL